MARTTTIAVISDGKIIKALNFPGKPAANWRDYFVIQVARYARESAPVNKVSDAMHRGGAVGEYKRSFEWDRIGSNGHKLYGRVYNTASYANYVERGKGPSAKDQFFSWGKGTRMFNADPLGDWYVLTVHGKVRGMLREVGAREGHHTLENAFERTVRARRLSRLSKVV